jgi:hypothetical protein
MLRGMEVAQVLYNDLSVWTDLGAAHVVKSVANKLKLTKIDQEFELFKANF